MFPSTRASFPLGANASIQAGERGKTGESAAKPRQRVITEIEEGPCDASADALRLEAHVTIAVLSIACVPASVVSGSLHPCSPFLQHGTVLATRFVRGATAMPCSLPPTLEGSASDYLSGTARQRRFSRSLGTAW